MCMFYTIPKYNSENKIMVRILYAIIDRICTANSKIMHHGMLFKIPNSWSQQSNNPHTYIPHIWYPYIAFVLVYSSVDFCEFSPLVLYFYSTAERTAGNDSQDPSSSYWPAASAPARSPLSSLDQLSCRT